jgi:prepilin-type N-terminal cleavage/methylation domain-containing protein
MKNKENVSCTCSEMKVGTFISLTSFGNKKGFTLIELLVVISIIGVLSSVVLASLSSARQKAKEAAVRQGVRQLERIIQLHYDETGSYAGAQSPVAWVPQNTTCDGLFTGMSASLRSQAINICKSIVANSPAIWGTPGHSLLVGNPLDLSQKFSIMATLNANNSTFFCTGSGGTSDNAWYWTNSGGQDIQGNQSLWPTSPAGCYYNP